VTLQTCAVENLRLCQWGDEQTRQWCADGERGSQSARAENHKLRWILGDFTWVRITSFCARGGGLGVGWGKQNITIYSSFRVLQTGMGLGIFFLIYHTFFTLCLT
jgi:hypothetical protein